MKEDHHWLNRWGIPLAAILVAGLVASSFYPMYSGISERSPRTKAVNDVRGLVLGCRSYAADNHGNYPSTLKSLYPDYTDYLPIFEGSDEKGENRSPMIYYPGLTETSDPNAPLVEHPYPYFGKRIIGYANGKVLEAK